MNYQSMAPAYTSVQAPRRTLAPVTVAATPPSQTSNSSTPGWPEPVKDYVRRAFAPENVNPEITHQELEKHLKLVITQAAESGRLLSTDWVNHPLPQQIILNQRAMRSLMGNTLATPTYGSGFGTPLGNQASPPSAEKKRPFDEPQENDLSPPWRNKKAKNGNNPLADRITKNKAQDKKAKKAQNHLAPSSKFNAELESRAKRFGAALYDSPISREEEMPSGPVVGTCQDIFKGYFRLTRAPRPHEVRPQPVLEQAFDLLKKKWKKDNDYVYICDQFKAIRQDLMVQHIKNAFTVEVYQVHAQISLEKGDLGEYNQCQTQLKALYAMGINGKSGEFLAYRILYFIHTANRTGLNQVLAELTAADKVKPEIQHALAVRSAVASGNYHRLFRLYLSCPNLGAYLMDMFVKRERLLALAKACRAYGGAQVIRIRFLSEELGFESDEESTQFIIDNGAQTFVGHDDKGIFLNPKAAAIFAQASATAYQKIDIKGQI